MPKKTNVKRRKSAPKKNPYVSKFFTFPVLVVIAFTVLVVITLFQITKPVEGVREAEVSQAQK